MNINAFMQDGINDIMKTIGRSYLKSKAGRAFLLQMVPQIHRSAVRREEEEQKGTHVPPFLIASIASQCNLRCAGCYARANGACAEQSSDKPDLSAAEWGAVFEEASSLGVAFILLAGGEPFLRKDVLKAAAACPNMIFPIFTNGTMLDDAALLLLEQNRNLIPVISLEGEEDETDIRRGAGTYQKLERAMARLNEKQILFGASITVTRENMKQVLQPLFVQKLRSRGCGIVFYVEYVPIDKTTAHLALKDAEMKALQAETEALRKHMRDVVILSFPGDEALMGGCLASGRGFFHINAHGGAEPCPFSPYAKDNVRQTGIRQVLHSKFMEDVRAISASAGEHQGGCVLFEHEEAVKRLCV